MRFILTITSEVNKSKLPPEGNVAKFRMRKPSPEFPAKELKE